MRARSLPVPNERRKDFRAVANRGGLRREAGPYRASEASTTCQRPLRRTT